MSVKTSIKTRNRRQIDPSGNRMLDYGETKTAFLCTENNLLLDAKGKPLTDDNNNK